MAIFSGKNGFLSMVKKISIWLLVVILFVFFDFFMAYAHFGVIKPDNDFVAAPSQPQLHFMVAFMHPFEQEFMDMARPKRFGVVLGEQVTDLTERLKPVKNNSGIGYWIIDYKFQRPGLYWFFMEPEPYWEAAENIFIQHFTKVAVSAYGMELGWERPIGLPLEIIPSVRPIGLWTGNAFCGQVLFHGLPVQKGVVEVEYFNEKQNIKAPYAAYITQTLLTDENGRFCYSMPKAGWWGFAALVERENELEHNGKRVGLELGGVIWLQVRDMK